MSSTRKMNGRRPRAGDAPIGPAASAFPHTRPHAPASAPSRAVALCGTEQPDNPGRVLRAGPLSVEFDKGQLRYLKVNGIEVLRAIGFLVRDENWGTYAPAISDLTIDEGADGFTVRYHAVCSRPGQEIASEASITGSPTGLEFSAKATPATDFLTARTGFVVLHPLKGVVGGSLEVEHVDGTIERSTFPQPIDPVQPFRDIRALTHEVTQGLRAVVRFEGDTWEMEDHRNWTDASFKTYVRPLILPWPYTLKAGEVVAQSVSVKLVGKARTSSGKTGPRDVELRFGRADRKVLPQLGLGVPAEEIEHAARELELLRRAAPGFLQCHFDPRDGHGLDQLRGYCALSEEAAAPCVLEVVVESIEDTGGELKRLARMVQEAKLPLSAIAVCPVGDLKSVLPGGPRPPAPPLEALYASARAAFPRVRLGGGMFSFFTELNRKRPPAGLLDFVMNTTCPIVHAADDRSVMETMEALPYQVATARSFLGAVPYRVGPSAIGCRDNPHGATYTPNPDNERVCLARADPRQRGLFGAAWSLSYLATLAHAGVEAISLGAPTGPLGLIYRNTSQSQPWYDSLAGGVYPMYHVFSGLARGAGSRLVPVDVSDPGLVCALAYRARKGTTLWLANLTAEERRVQLGSRGGPVYGGMLDETTFLTATSDPRAFQEACKPLGDPSHIMLKPYAVAILALGD